MSTYLKQLLLTLILSMTIMTAVSAETFHHERHQVNLVHETPWKLVPFEEKYQVLSLAHDDQMATLNVFAYGYLEVVTINGFQERRKTAGYDAWINLGERIGTDFETKRANVEDSYVAIYAKNQLNAELGYDKLLVAHYSFVKGKVGYVVSVHTQKERWQTVKNDFQEVLKSFWVGEGERPSYDEESIIDNSWSMVGKNAANHRSIDLKIRLPKDLKEAFEIPTLNTRERSPPIYVDGAMIFQRGNAIEKRSIYDGSLIWKREGLALRSAIVRHNEDLFAFLRKGGKPSLERFKLSSGETIYAKTVSHNSTIAPVIQKGKLYASTGKQMSCYHLGTGTLLWTKEFEHTISYYPVMDSKYLAVVLNRRQLLILDSGSGEELWKKEFRARIQYSPIMKGDTLIIAQKKVSGIQKTPVFRAFSLKTEEALWRFEYQGKYQSVAMAPALEDGLYMVSIRIGDEALLMALDANTGAKIWEHPYRYYPHIKDNGMVLSKGQVYTISALEGGSPSLLALSSKEGFLVANYPLEKFLKEDSSKLTELQAYKESLILKEEGPSQSRRLILK